MKPKKQQLETNKVKMETGGAFNNRNHLRKLLNNKFLCKNVKKKINF